MGTECSEPGKSLLVRSWPLMLLFPLLCGVRGLLVDEVEKGCVKLE